MIERIEQVVADHFGITVDQMRTGKSRSELDARHFLWYFLHFVYGYSGRDVASRYGTTRRVILHYSALVRDRLGREPFFSKNCSELQGKLKEIEAI